MSYDEFFTDSDKPYAENLNDALLLLDAFDMTVPVEMPDMFNNGQFSSTVDVPRKCGVGIVTLKSVASGVTVGTSSISGTGAVTFRVYPNFNSFYKWKSIILDKTGTVSIAFKKTDGTNISATVASDGTISDAAALKELQEIDVVLTLTSATISGILIEFTNNQTQRTRSTALLEADQLTNITGTIASGDTNVVDGGTVYTALTNGLALKEDAANKVTSLDNSDTHFPSSKAVKTVTDAKENVSNKVTTLDNSDTHYPSSKAVKTVTDGKANTSHTHTAADITDLIDVIYPVGAIYISVNSTHPETLFGGRWTQIKGRFLLSKDDDTSSGDTGGYRDATLVAHKHDTGNNDDHFITVENYTNWRATIGRPTIGGDGPYHYMYTEDLNYGVGERRYTETVGDDSTGRNMPPYLVVYMWKRMQ